MLPIILLPDILSLSIDEIKKNAFALFFLAFISVILSIAIAVFITPYLLPEYQFTMGMLITLFSMLMATDAITVSSIFSKFDLPDRLKIYAEGESLFNDVTALVIFYFVAIPLISGKDVTILEINYVLLKVLISSIAVGVSVAYIGYLCMKLLKDPIEQFIVIYLVVIVSFMLAENFHIAGILSIIASVLSFKLLMQKEIQKQTTTKAIDELEKKESTSYKMLLKFLSKVPAITKREFRIYKREAFFIGIFANAIVFIAMANIFDTDLLIKYYKEIFIVFTITTVIRFLPMITIVKYYTLPHRWINALTFAGVKGGLTIIMVHSIPNTFIYKEMFVAIVIGTVILTTFLYTFFLMYYVSRHKEAFENDREVYNSSNSDLMQDITTEIKDILEKDPITNAFNKSIINKIEHREYQRALRYQLELSFIKIDISNTNDTILKAFSDIIHEKIRDQDSFGKIDNSTFLLIMPNTPATGATILSQRVYKKVKKELGKDISIYFGITELNISDTTESIDEKLNDALEQAKADKNEDIRLEI
jgi:CPA1 family monovalent cation:H+ antiporter